MRLEFHPEVSTDVTKIIRYYGEVAGSQLAAEFDRALHNAFRKAAATPHAFNIRECDLRRVNLERFPYHLLFRIVGDETVRVLVVRHHSREPHVGIRRR